MELIQKEISFSAINEEGHFEGIAAAYGNVDSHGDRIEAGAFKSADGMEVPILFAHKTDQPIGIATVKDTPQGLMLKGRLILETKAGSEALALVKAGVLKGLSVGFHLPKNGFSMVDRARSITKAFLKEVSLVVFPANNQALITALKEEAAEKPSYPSPVLRTVSSGSSPFEGLLRFTIKM